MILFYERGNCDENKLVIILDNEKGLKNILNSGNDYEKKFYLLKPVLIKNTIKLVKKLLKD